MAKVIAVNDENRIEEGKSYLRARIEYFDDVIEPAKEELKTMALKGISLIGTL